MTNTNCVLHYSNPIRRSSTSLADRYLRDHCGQCCLLRFADDNRRIHRLLHTSVWKLQSAYVVDGSLPSCRFQPHFRKHDVSVYLWLNRRRQNRMVAISIGIQRVCYFVRYFDQSLDDVLCSRSLFRGQLRNLRAHVDLLSLGA